MAIRTKDIGEGRMRTWSDIGMKIERDGVRYAEAIDPTDRGRTYTETDEPVESGDEDVTEEDKDAALRRFGVEV